MDILIPVQMAEDQMPTRPQFNFVKGIDFNEYQFLTTETSTYINFKPELFKNFSYSSPIYFQLGF